MPSFAIQQRVAWSDVDLAKIVYFPKYLTYFENAELEWFASQGWDYEEFLTKSGIWIPRVATQVNFRSPARLRDLLQIEMHLSRLGRTSFTLGFDVFRLPERTHVVDGTITVAVVSRTNFRPIKVPAKLVRMLRGISERAPVGASRSRKK